MTKMTEVKITKEDYDNIVALNGDYGAEARYLDKHLPDWIIYGYGLYGHGKVSQNNGEYFVAVDIGSSCD